MQKILRNRKFIVIMLLSSYMFARYLQRRHQDNQNVHKLSAKPKRYYAPQKKNYSSAKKDTQNMSRKNLTWCSGQLKYFKNSESNGRVALASFPGAGNTWLRYLLQQATGKQNYMSCIIILNV